MRSDTYGINEELIERYKDIRTMRYTGGALIVMGIIGSQMTTGFVSGLFYAMIALQFLEFMLWREKVSRSKEQSFTKRFLVLYSMPILVLVCIAGEVNNFGMKVLASIVIVTLVIVPMLIYRLGKGLNGDV